MGSIEEINIRNRTYYVFKGTVNSKNFNSSLVKIDKKSLSKTLIFIISDISQ